MTPALLDRFPALAALDDAARGFLRAHLQPVRLPVGHVLFRPGELCPSFTFVLSGSVAVRRITRSGKELLLYRVAPGQTCVMSTACLINPDRYAAEGVTEAPVEALCLAPADFAHLLAESEAFRQFAFGSCAARIGDLMQRIEELADIAVGRRLAERLLALQSPAGHVAATHQALASDIGTAREVVTRALRDFAARGWVRVGRGDVVVLRGEALLNLAGGRE
ncbi:MAG: hypothetical protein BGP12_13225 [Rhodospirillales bacterium 70-18]|nr:MAG: hypothetical protein BGP12_13225 [Rhodospirillales bacterium 70-18]